MTENERDTFLTQEHKRFKNRITKMRTLALVFIAAISVVIVTIYLFVEEESPARRPPKSHKRRDLKQHLGKSDNQSEFEQEEQSVWGFNDVTPVVLVPGLTGAKLFIAVNNKQDQPPQFTCPTTSPFHFSWINLTIFGIFKRRKTTCELWSLAPEFESNSGFYWDVNTTVSTMPNGVNFGDPQTIQCLNRDDANCGYIIQHTAAGYYKLLIKTMRKWGYRIESTLFGAPYDWRLDYEHPSQEAFYGNLTNLLTTVRRSTQKKVVLLGHSNGNIMLAKYLRQHTTAMFRRKHIEALVTVAAPFGGAVDSVVHVTSGINIGAWIYDVITKEQDQFFTSHMPTVHGNLPLSSAFGRSFVFAQINETKYSVKDMSEYLQRIGQNNATFAYLRYSDENRLPNLKYYCAYGKGVRTTSFVKYQGSLSEPKETHTSDGDGTVNYQSLSLCKGDPNLAEPPKELTGVDHTKILRNDDFFSYLQRIVARDALHNINDHTKPILRTIVKSITEHNQILECFSQVPRRQCQANFRPGPNHEEIVIFSCFPKDSDKAVTLRATLRKNQIVHLTEFQAHFAKVHENDPTLPLRNRPNKKIADRNRRIKVLLENYTAKEAQDRNPLIFLKAAQKFLMKQDYTESGQIEVNNDDDQD